MTEPTIIPDRFAVRRRTAASWASVNEILYLGEIGLERDTGKFKFGDGVTRWNSLPYAMRDATLTLSDITTGNASTSAHGFLPKLPNDPSKFLDGQGNFNVPAGAGSAWTTVKKTTDENRNTTTTYAADSALQFSAAAGTRYSIRIVVHFAIANATMDFKYSLVYSGTLTSDKGSFRHSAAGSAAGTDNQGTGTQAALVGVSIPLTATTFGVGFIEVDLIMLTNTAGTFSFSWAQNTSDGANATVYAGSYLEYMTS